MEERFFLYRHSLHKDDESKLNEILNDILNIKASVKKEENGYTYVSGEELITIDKKDKKFVLNVNNNQIYNINNINIKKENEEEYKKLKKIWIINSLLSKDDLSYDNMRSLLTRENKKDLKILMLYKDDEIMENERYDVIKE